MSSSRRGTSFCQKRNENYESVYGMTFRLRIGVLLTILAITVLPLMADTKIIHRWVLTGVPMPRFQKMMVLPPRNEMMEGELKQRIKESSLDSVLVVRPKAVRTETEEVVTGGIYMPPPGYYTFWPYWNMAYGGLYPASSYTKENVMVRVEFNLYSTKDEKLVWSGESDTVYEKNFERLGKGYAQALAKQLKKDKVIRKK